MTSIRCSALLFILAAISVSASAQRIKRPPADEAQLARIAVEDAMNDGSLQPGDIIATTKEFRAISRHETGRKFRLCCCGRSISPREAARTSSASSKIKSAKAPIGEIRSAY